jgi:hypothetical protein
MERPTNSRARNEFDFDSFSASVQPGQVPGTATSASPDGSESLSHPAPTNPEQAYEMLSTLSQAAREHVLARFAPSQLASQPGPYLRPAVQLNNGFNHISPTGRPGEYPPRLPDRPNFLQLAGGFQPLTGGFPQHTGGHGYQQGPGLFPDGRSFMNNGSIYGSMQGMSSYFGQGGHQYPPQAWPHGH